MWILVLGEHCLDVIVHGAAACAFAIVPGDINVCILDACPVYHDLVVLSQDRG